mmetsp:Transcript_4565/g.7364  ORF Transcript_4565/g.7364 Transcript_4565/m.7364 type:complete len:82 (+) Transcript_4565:112-357(+)
MFGLWEQPISTTSVLPGPPCLPDRTVEGGPAGPGDATWIRGSTPISVVLTPTAKVGKPEEGYADDTAARTSAASSVRKLLS